MADRLRRTENIWLFGQLQDFNIYESTLALANSHFRQGPHGSVLQMQKNQIILHTTDGNGTAHQTIDGWNGDNVNFPSANFIVELARHRLNAAQPYSDVTEVVPSEQVSFHAQIMNNNSIGIEHTNITNVWESDRDLPSFVAPLNAADSSPRPAPHPTPAHPHPHVETRLRPGDYNRWYHVKRSGPHVIGDTYATNVSNLDFATDVKAFEEEQYLAMILLLRFLCIKHRIPRRFFGDTLAEKMQRWWNFHVPDPHHPGMPDPSHPDITTPETQSKLMRFRGILAHINCHKDKICGGPAVHRNRLFRGITDEWWMPVQLHAAERGYYTGPFDPPDSQTATPNDQSYVRWTTAGMQNELFHAIKLEALP